MDIKETLCLLLVVICFLGAMFLMWREIFRTMKMDEGK